jgi:hypothetical protein
MTEDESKWLRLTDRLAPGQDAPASDAPASDAPRPEEAWVSDPHEPRQDAPAGDAATGDAPAGDAPRPEEAWVSDPLEPGQDALAGDAPRSQVAFLRAHLAAERAKKQRYKGAVRKQNTQLGTLVENADDVIGLAKGKMEEKANKLRKDAKRTAVYTVGEVAANAAMLNPVGVVAGLAFGVRRGYEQVSEAQELDNLYGKIDLLWGGHQTEAASVSDSNVDGLNVDLLEMNEEKIARLLEKFPPAEVDNILDLPAGSAVRHVRLKVLEALLDERAAELAQAVAHNEGEGASKLAAIERELEQRRTDVKAAAEAALTAGESLDADLAALASVAAALTARESAERGKHSAELASLRNSHCAKLQRVASGFRAADMDVAENTAPVRAKLAAEEQILVIELPRRLEAVQNEQAALQPRRDALEGRAAKVRGDKAWAAALVDELVRHEEHAQGEASAVTNADAALKDAKHRVADWRERAKEMPDEDLATVESCAKAMNAASMRVTPVAYTRAMPAQRGEWQRARSLREREHFAAREADKAALVEILSLNPESCLARETRSVTQKTVLTKVAVPGRCCGLLSPRRHTVASEHQTEQKFASWGWGVGEHDVLNKGDIQAWGGVEIDLDSGLVTRLDFVGAHGVYALPDVGVMRGMSKLSGIRLTNTGGYMPVIEALRSTPAAAREAQKRREEEERKRLEEEERKRLEEVERKRLEEVERKRLEEEERKQREEEEGRQRALAAVMRVLSEDGETDDVEALAAAMRAHLGNAEVQKNACRALSSLAAGTNDEKKIRAGKAGAVEALAAAMRAHPRHAEVQQWACSALSSLASGISQENRTRAGKAGAVEALEAAMRAHSGHAKVQQWACRALSSLAYGNVENITRAGKAGAVEAVASAMRAHLVIVEVQQWACWALINLACGTNEENITRAGKSGAVEAVAAAMRTYSGNAILQEWACVSLSSLITNNLENKTWAEKAGVKTAAKAALKAHPKNEDVVRRAQNLIEKMG